MKTLTMTVERCFDCPHCMNVGWNEEVCTNRNKRPPELAIDRPYDLGRIPEWCPLLDAEKSEGIAMKWTSTAPTGTGHYWFRKHESDDPMIVKVEPSRAGLLVSRCGCENLIPALTIDGEWLGPISPAPAGDDAAPPLILNNP